MTPSISAVIVTYNARQDLDRCLESLAKQNDVALEVIVYDNASSDGTAQMVAERYPWVRLMASSANAGLTKGVNQAIGVAHGEYICLLDSDTVIEPGCMRILKKFMDGHANAGVVAARMLNVDGSIQETARNFPRVSNALLGRQTLLARWFPNNPITLGYLRRSDLKRTDPFEVDWVAAACMMFRRDLVARIGHLDEDFFVYWVDADWCKRVRNAGLSVWCVPQARVFHIEQNRIGKKKSPRGIRSFHEGAYLFYRKHYVKSSWHPMAQLARIGLGTRCRLMLLTNSWMKR